jgi:hypothetical protein
MAIRRSVLRRCRRVGCGLSMISRRRRGIRRGRHLIRDHNRSRLRRHALHKQRQRRIHRALSNRRPRTGVQQSSSLPMRGGELLQHWFDPRGQHQAHERLQPQRIQLGEAACVNCRSGVVVATAPCQLTPAPLSSSSVSSDTCHGTQNGPLCARRAVGHALGSRGMPRAPAVPSEVVETAATQAAPR